MDRIVKTKCRMVKSMLNKKQGFYSYEINDENYHIFSSPITWKGSLMRCASPCLKKTTNLAISLYHSEAFFLCHLHFKDYKKQQHLLINDHPDLVCLYDVILREKSFLIEEVN